jgi:hypothetical protein
LFFSCASKTAAEETQEEFSAPDINKDEYIEKEEEYDEEEFYVLFKKVGYRNFVISFPGVAVNDIKGRFIYEHNEDTVKCNVSYIIDKVEDSSEIRIWVNNVPDFNSGVLKFYLSIYINESDRIDLDSEITVRFVNGDVVVTE